MRQKQNTRTNDTGAAALLYIGAILYGAALPHRRQETHLITCMVRLRVSDQPTFLFNATMQAIDHHVLEYVVLDHCQCMHME